MLPGGWQRNLTDSLHDLALWLNVYYAEPAHRLATATYLDRHMSHAEDHQHDDRLTAQT